MHSIKKFSTDFRKILKCSFPKSLSIWTRVVPCVRTTDGQTNMTNPIVTLLQFAKAPKSR